MKLILFLLLSATSFGQKTNQFFGKVIDEDTKAGIPFASIYILDLNIGTHTDTEGHFSFEQDLPSTFEVRITAMNYEKRIFTVGPDVNNIIEMKHIHVDMDEVIVSSPGGGTIRDNAFNIDRLEVKKPEIIMSSNPVERLTSITGVESANLGPGIFKPVIRGLQGLRITTLVDNVIIQNQQWGADHGMGVNELGVGSIEVIKGPSSLLYGSDAMGGIIHFIKEDMPFVNHQKINASSSFETARMSTKNTLQYAVSGNKVHFRVSGLYENSSDYRLPNNQFVKNSRFLQYGGKANLSFNGKNWTSNISASYSNFEVGIPGHTHDSIIKKEDFISNQQSRKKSLPLQTTKNIFVSIENKLLIGKNVLRIIVSNTNNNLTEFEEKWTIPGFKLNLNSSALSILYKHKLSEKWKIVYGSQSNYQINRNSSLALERLMDDYTQLDNGLFVMAYFKGKKRTRLQFGGRVDHRLLSVPNQQITPQYFNPNLAVGIVKSFQKSLFKVNLSSGYRAPHTSELLSDGVHHGSLRYEKGDKNLRPEQAIQLDLTYERDGEHLRVVLNPYYNLIKDYISLRGTDSIISGFNVYQYTQSDLSQLYGVDLGVHYHPHFIHNLHFETTFSYVSASVIKGDNFNLIPQPKWRNTLKWEFEKKRNFYIQDISLQHHYFLPQNSAGMNETPSVDYHVLNGGINLKYVKNMDLTISVGVKNILNAQYANHLSRLKPFGIQDLARNYYIKLNYQFQYKTQQKSTL